MFHIILDTEVFRHEQLHFGSKRFQQLAAFAAAEEVTIYVADVTVGEVRRAISTAVATALEVLSRKNRTALGILVQTDRVGLAGLLSMPDKDVLISALNSRFDQLLADLRAVTVSTDQISVADLRDRYFQALPPFSPQAAKKHEFPDALLMLAAEQLAKSAGHPFHVVSGDKGVIEATRFSPRLKPVPSLPTMITKVHETVQATAALAKAAEHAFAAKTTDIVARVKELFEDSGINVEDEWEGEAEDVEVADVELGDPSVDSISGAVVTLGFGATISFTANVTVADPSQTAYDDGERMVFGYLTAKVAESEYVEGTIEVDVDTQNAEASAILEISLFAGNVSVRYPWPS